MPYILFFLLFILFDTVAVKEICNKESQKLKTQVFENNRILLSVVSTFLH
jgi:hypothetical protein